MFGSRITLLACLTHAACTPAGTPPANSDMPWMPLKDGGGRHKGDCMDSRPWP